jgi:hypothetical protein
VPRLTFLSLLHAVVVKLFCSWNSSHLHAMLRTSYENTGSYVQPCVDYRVWSFSRNQRQATYSCDNKDAHWSWSITILVKSETQLCGMSQRLLACSLDAAFFGLIFSQDLCVECPLNITLIQRVSPAYSMILILTAWIRLSLHACPAPFFVFFLFCTYICLLVEIIITTTCLTTADEVCWK